MTTMVNDSQTFGMEMDPYEEDLYYGPPEGPEMDVVYVIEAYLFPIIMLVGIVGNVLAMPALYVISLQTWSTVFYLSLLSGVDLLILLVRVGDTWYYQMTMSSLSERIMNSSDALCKTYNFVFNFVLHLSPWLMVAVAMEMTIAMRWPQRVYAMCTLERANNVVMLLIILLVCLDINYFWTWGVPSRDVGCRYTEEFSTEFRDTIWPAMTNIIQFLTPLIIVSLCFFITAATMISRRPRAQKGIERELKKYFLELKTLRDFRVICLILSLIFMCLTLFTITITFVDFLEVKGYIKLDDEAYMSYSMKMIMLKTLDMTMYSLFYSLKIFFYVGCSSTFRATLKQGFFWLWLRTRRAIFKVPKPGRNQRQLHGERKIMANHQSKPFIEKPSSSVAKPEEDSLSDEDAVMVTIKRENASSLSPNRISLRDCDTVDHHGTDV